MFAINPATIENTGEVIMCNHELVPCAASKKKWDAKLRENKGKCIMHTAMSQNTPFGLK